MDPAREADRGIGSATLFEAREADRGIVSLSWLMEPARDADRGIGSFLTDGARSVWMYD